MKSVSEKTSRLVVTGESTSEVEIVMYALNNESPIVMSYLRKRDRRLVSLGASTDRRWGHIDALGVRDFTVLGVCELPFKDVLERDVSVESRNTENIKFLERSCDERNKTPKHTSPKVSAVSCTISKTLRLYRCCQSVSDKGILSATQA